MKVFCCQLDIVWEDKAANFSKVERLFDGAAPPRGSLLVLPEMCFTGFSMNVAKVAADEPARTQGFLSGLARRLGVYVLAGLATQREDGRGRNQAVWLTPNGDVQSRFQKLHLFTPAGEHEHFEAGNQVVTLNWSSGTVSPFICYDLRFPESFRTALGKGVELFVVIANWPTVREDHWRTLLQARAIENQAYVVGVNRCGSDPSHDYPGASLIVAPDGTVCADAGREEGVISAEIDFEMLREWRRKFPALADRRPDL